MSDRTERRTVYFLVKRERQYSEGERWFEVVEERMQSRKAALRQARTEQRRAEASDLSKPPVGVYRARQEVDLDDHYTVRNWASKKKVGLNPEEFPEIVEYLKDESEDLEETWADKDVDTTDYYIENSSGEEIEVRNYS